MKFSHFFVAAASAFVGVAYAQDEIANYEDSVKVLSMEVAPESLKEHHTDHFKIEDGFVVRRGQAFHLLVETSEEIDIKKFKIDVENNLPVENNNPKFETKLESRVSGKTYKLRVSTQADAPIGKYENLVLTIGTTDDLPGGETPEVEYEYPFPVYLVFNPWLKEDHVVYIPHEDLRQEHILNEYGNVYCGSLNSYDNIKWYYGQSNQITLDAVFHLLEKLDRSLAGDAIKVIQAMSHHQGMMRKKGGGILVGDEDAILEGNWGDFPFQEDTSPEIWTSTTDILNRWKDTGKPTQYGQCWVFAALQNGLMRAVGVGSRQITAFGAVVDSTKIEIPDHKNHHVIDEYYNANGTSMYNLGRGWNYHSWNDIYVNRDNKEYSGWNSLDGTPPGTIGPAPLRAVKDLVETDFNTTDLISTVHSTQRTFLVDCKEPHSQKDKLKGCKVKKQLKYDHSGLKLIVTTQTLKNGTLAQKNITDQFVNPKLDAFIPFDNDTLTGGRRLQTAGDDEDDNLKIVPNTYTIVVGQNVQGSIEIDTADLKEDEKIELNLAFTLQTMTGKTLKTIFSSSEDVLVKANKILIPYFVDHSAYLQRDLEEVYVQIVATAKTQDDDWYFAKEIINVDVPAVDIKVPNKIDLSKKKDIKVQASFRNPLQFNLKDVCLTIHSHQLEFTDHSNNSTNLTKCVDVKAGKVIKIDTTVNVPEEAGTYYILASIRADYLPSGIFHQEIVVTGKSKKSLKKNLKKMTLLKSNLKKKKQTTLEGPTDGSAFEEIIFSNNRVQLF